MGGKSFAIGLRLCTDLKTGPFRSDRSQWLNQRTRRLSPMPQSDGECWRRQSPRWLLDWRFWTRLASTLPPATCPSVSNWRVWNYDCSEVEMIRGALRNNILANPVWRKRSSEL